MSKSFRSYATAKKRAKKRLKEIGNACPRNLYQHGVYRHGVRSLGRRRVYYSGVVRGKRRNINIWQSGLPQNPGVLEEVVREQSVVRLRLFDAGVVHGIGECLLPAQVYLVLDRAYSLAYILFGELLQKKKERGWSLGTRAAGCV